MLTITMMAATIPAEDVQRALVAGPSNLLLIDCRSFMAFNTYHIQTAHNVHCPPILKRRSGGHLKLENVIRCPTTRSQLMAGTYSMVVVYDDNTQSVTDLSKDSNAYLVLRTLREENVAKRLYLLQGGFEAFFACAHHLCSSHTAANLYFNPTSLTQGQLLDSAILRDTRSSHRTHEKGDPVQILPWLYLGNEYHASQVDRLESHGISALLNVSLLDINPPSWIKYKKLPISDNLHSDISHWFPEAIDFIDQIRCQQGKVLVHCQAGISRSATICIAYLMYTKHLTLEDAFDYLKDKRSVIAPNMNFMQQLTEFENQLLHDGLTLTHQMSPILDCHSPCATSTVTITTSSSSCTKQAVFELPLMAKANFDLPLLASPTLPLCHSPLLSPS